VVATVLGMLTGVGVHGLSSELQLARMPLVVLNGLAFGAAFTAVGLAASVTFDRPGPALGLSLGFLLVNYFLEVLGSLWEAARWTQEWSLMHRFRADELLIGAGVFRVARHGVGITETG